MAVQFHNAPTVSSIDRSATIGAGQSSSDRQSPAEYYTRQQSHMGTDSLQMGHDVAQALTATVQRHHVSVVQPWQPSPAVVGILIVLAVMAALYWVVSLEVAIVTALIVLIGVLLYGLGFDRTLRSWNRNRRNRPVPQH